MDLQDSEQPVSSRKREVSASSDEEGVNRASKRAKSDDVPPSNHGPGITSSQADFTGTTPWPDLASDHADYPGCHARNILKVFLEREKITKEVFELSVRFCYMSPWKGFKKAPGGPNGFFLDVKWVQNTLVPTYMPSVKQNSSMPPEFQQLLMSLRDHELIPSRLRMLSSSVRTWRDLSQLWLSFGDFYPAGSFPRIQPQYQIEFRNELLCLPESAFEDSIDSAETRTLRHEHFRDGFFKNHFVSNSWLPHKDSILICTTDFDIRWLAKTFCMKNEKSERFLAWLVQYDYDHIPANPSSGWNKHSIDEVRQECGMDVIALREGTENARSRANLELTMLLEGSSEAQEKQESLDKSKADVYFPDYLPIDPFPW